MSAESGAALVIVFQLSTLCLMNVTNTMTDSPPSTTVSETKGLAIGIGLDLRLLVTRGATWRGGAPVARAPPPK